VKLSDLSAFANMPVTQEVAGSNPVGPANIFKDLRAVVFSSSHCNVLENVGTP
jgi:hypothetical protein